MSMPFFAEPDFDKNKPFIIYGYGLICLNSLFTFLAHGIRITAIFDKNPKYNNTTILGIPIYSPDRLGEFDRDVNVYISTIQENWTITEMLNELGFSALYYCYEPNMYHYRNVASLKERWRGIISENAEEIKCARSLFTEKHSLDVFDARLNAYENSEFIPLEKMYSKGGYFLKDIFSFTDNEVFVDAGCHAGESSLAFRSTVNGKYGSIYAFDGEELCAALTSRKFEHYGLYNAYVHHMAIYDKEGTVRFDNKGYADSGLAGRISYAGGIEVPCTSLDEFFKDKPLPTLIKMDIEGAEADALNGTRKIIAEVMPKLSICVYHSIEHLWEVPLIIHEAQAGKGYELYLRHQGSLFDTICFAAPKK